MKNISFSGRSLLEILQEIENMIKCNQDYRSYLYQDALSMGINPNSRLSMAKAYLSNPRWRFIIKLRRAELFKNLNGLFYKVLYFIFYYDYKRLGLKLGYTIPLNVCGEGLSLPHYGTIVISKLAKIGSNCRIHVCVNIGESNGSAPIIGDNVYIGPGAKLFGEITLGSGIKIGANAVVNKSFLEENVIIAGVPAKIVKKGEI